MTFQEKIKIKIEQIAGITPNSMRYEDIASLGGPDGVFVNRCDISLTKTLNLLKSGWVALPF